MVTRIHLLQPMPLEKIYGPWAGPDMPYPTGATFEGDKLSIVDGKRAWGQGDGIAGGYGDGFSARQSGCGYAAGERSGRSCNGAELGEYVTGRGNHEVHDGMGGAPGSGLTDLI